MFQIADNSFSALVTRQLHGIGKQIRSRVSDANAHMPLLRIGLGFGWLVAGFDKATSPEWYPGDTLFAFLNNQLATNAIYVSLYESFVVDFALPNIATIASVMMFSELLVGLAIVFGILTRSALSLGILMNINWLLMGVLSPSILYMLIQGVLFSKKSDAKLSITSYLAKRNQAPSYTVMPKEKPKRLSRSASSSVTRSSNGNRAKSKVKVGKDVVMGGMMKGSFLQYTS